MSEQTADIVQRLRAKRVFRIAENSSVWTETDPDDAVRADAAAEIERLRATLRALLEASPEIGAWMFDVMPPSQRDAYARARGRAKEALAHD